MSIVEQMINDELIEEIRKKTDEEKFDIYLKLIKTLSEDTKNELLKWIEEQLKIKEEKLKSENTKLIYCKNCKYDKSEFYVKSGNSWCPRCKGLNYHTED